MRFTLIAIGIAVVVVLSTNFCRTAQADDKLVFEGLSQQFDSTVRPLLTAYCNDCHSTENREGEFDLERFTTIDDVRHDATAWQRVRLMLGNGEMPPRESEQPSAKQRQQLQNWVAGYLNAEALAHAGDPGPIVLRRLNNAEYTYTIRDLTGIHSLAPTREFPVDGAAGEGFTNTGEALAMSPSLVQKYLTAAKEIADHTVLMPDGIRFSPHQSRRDRTDDLMARIQAFYRRFTDDSGSSAVDLQGIKFDTNQGGRLPLQRYFAATIEQRDELRNGSTSIARVAAERDLNAKYLERLWRTLHDKSSGDNSHLLCDLRQKWRASENATALVHDVQAWQQVLWKFNTIGHFGRQGGPTAWMQATSPVSFRQHIAFELPDSPPDDDVIIHLVVGDAGDGSADDVVIWRNLRLEGRGVPALSLRSVKGFEERLETLRQQMLAQTVGYLAAVADVRSHGDPIQAAETHHVDADLLKVWLDYLRVRGGTVDVQGRFSEQSMRVANYDFINGWGSNATPSIVSNASDQEVRIPGMAKPHSMLGHPSPTHFAAVGWQSPIDGSVSIQAFAADAHPECGNGVEVAVQHRTAASSTLLWRAAVNVGGSATLPVQTISVREGELISIILGPNQANHSCDLTQFNLVIRETTGEKRSWDLATSVSSDILVGNPHEDQYRNSGVWHFYQGEVASTFDQGPVPAAVPRGSLLAGWTDETDVDRRVVLSQRIRDLAVGQPPEDPQSPDSELLAQLRALPIPFDHPQIVGDSHGDDRFGNHPRGAEIAETDLVIQAPACIEFRLPAALARGRQLVGDVKLDSKHGSQGTVQVRVTMERPDHTRVSPETPFLVNEGSNAHRRIESGLEAFRQLFPAALCYARIVPVDEVVTLALFHREDEHLQRLMLNEEQTATLNRLWDELYFVSQEPLKLVVAFDQISEFATQDRPDLVAALTPAGQQIRKRAAAFRERLIAAEPAHVDAVIALADRAWRRKLSDSERQAIRKLYDKLRRDELSHEEALRLTLVRVFTSPAFIYRRESQQAGRQSKPVSDDELANRMSYFLWSSLPDSRLRHAASTNSLSEDSVLLDQTRRMLKDARTRRLAIHFACQWLHVRDFDQNIEKNEALYPQFADLRGAMYEETVRFFEDMFRNDGSVLDMLDADHTFVNEALAKHYGITSVSGTEWRRVNNVRAAGRGGILSMGTVLASQSGASRTSPILRGNWVFETLLGERLPRPPANVPQIPDQAPRGLTARQLIEQHSSEAACAKCHEKIDPYGFALEQFDTIGRMRSQQMDTSTQLVDGTRLEGLAGLRDYLLHQRRDDVVRQFCRKLLGFALGRAVRLSDEPLLTDMQLALKTHDYRFSSAIEAIVTSQQFRHIRGRDFVDP